MEKIILVTYLYIGNVSRAKAEESIMDMLEFFRGTFENDVINYIIPVRTGESRVECINPRLVSANDYINVKGILDNCQAKLEEFLAEGKNS